MTSVLHLVSLLVVSQFLREVATGCGKQVIKDTRQSKIVGGYDTYEGEFPWVVSIRKHGNHHVRKRWNKVFCNLNQWEFLWQCGGVIVGQRWILTAAHCVPNKAHSSLVVRVGEHNLLKPDSYTRDYSLHQVHTHPNYSRMSVYKNLFQINNADIALLKTVHDIHLSEYAWPICFPPLNVPLLDQEALVIGWGKKSEKSDFYSEMLQKVQVKIISDEQCSNWFKLTGRELQITDQILCAGYQDGGKDACHGDSGGPLLVKQKASM